MVPKALCTAFYKFFYIFTEFFYSFFTLFYSFSRFLRFFTRPGLAMEMASDFGAGDLGGLLLTMSSPVILAAPARNAFLTFLQHSTLGSARPTDGGIGRRCVGKDQGVTAQCVWMWLIPSIHPRASPLLGSYAIQTKLWHPPANYALQPRKGAMVG